MVEACPSPFHAIFPNAPVSPLSCYERQEEWRSVHELSHFWVEGVAITAVGVFGICGNLLTILVLSQMDSNRSFNKLLVALSVVDTLLIVQTVGDTAILGVFSTGRLPAWYCALYPMLFHPLKGIIQTMTIYMVVAVSAERYKTVCFLIR